MIIESCSYTPFCHKCASTMAFCSAARGPCAYTTRYFVASVQDACSASTRCCVLMLAPDMGKLAHKAISFQNQFFWVIKTFIAAFPALIVLQTARGKRFLCGIIERLRPFPPLAFSGLWLGLRAAKSPHLRLDARWFGLCRRV